jgi:hypothetical protein
MSIVSLPPFFKFGTCRSNDENNPDTIELKVIVTQTFETEYSTCTRIMVKLAKKWIEMAFPLKQHESNNASLLNLWLANVEKGAIKPDKKITLRTWLGTSRNKRTIRRYKMEP